MARLGQVGPRLHGKDAELSSFPGGDLSDFELAQLNGVHVIGELHVVKRRVTAELLNPFQDCAGFATEWVEVEGEQCEPLRGDEVPVSISLGDEPKMEAGDLPSHFAQPGAFGVHVSARRADGGLLIAVDALPVGKVPGCLGQAFLQELDRTPASLEVGFEPLVLLLSILADAMRLADVPAGYFRQYEAHEHQNRRQPGLLLLKDGKPFPDGC